MNYGSVISIDGSIGVGKTTLIESLSKIFPFRTFPEPVEDNPFLDDYYREPTRWSFPMQMFMLKYRFTIHKLAAYEATGIGGYKGALIDRGMIPGDYVFAYTQYLCGHMTEREWQTYNSFFNILTSSFTPPSLIIYLDVEPDISMERIKKRARGAEVNITLEYLQKLRKVYLDQLVEIERGVSIWGRGVALERIPWNTDNRNVDEIANLIRRHAM